MKVSFSISIEREFLNGIFEFKQWIQLAENRIPSDSAMIEELIRCGMAWKRTLYAKKEALAEKSTNPNPTTSALIAQLYREHDQDVANIAKVARGKEKKRGTDGKFTRTAPSK